MGGLCIINASKHVFGSAYLKQTNGGCNHVAVKICLCCENAPGKLGFSWFIWFSPPYRSQQQGGNQPPHIWCFPLLLFPFCFFFFFKKKPIVIVLGQLGDQRENRKWGASRETGGGSFPFSLVFSLLIYLCSAVHWPFRFA